MIILTPAIVENCNRRSFSLIAANKWLHIKTDSETRRYEMTTFCDKKKTTSINLGNTAKCIKTRNNTSPNEKEKQVKNAAKQTGLNTSKEKWK